MGNAELPFSLLGLLLFMMIGPLQAIPLFASATAGMDRRAQIHTAFVAAGVAALALALAVLIGAGAMSRAGTSRSSLIIAAGVILAMTALRNILGTAAGPPADKRRNGKVALTPIAIPGIVTPVGVAILIIFASYFPDSADKLSLLGVTAAILVLDLLAMLGANWFLRAVGTAPLVLLGAVFGVLQAAMAVEMIVSGILRSPLAR